MEVLLLGCVYSILLTENTLVCCAAANAGVDVADGGALAGCVSSILLSEEVLDCLHSSPKKAGGASLRQTRRRDHGLVEEIRLRTHSNIQLVAVAKTFYTACLVVCGFRAILSCLKEEPLHRFVVSSILDHTLCQLFSIRGDVHTLAVSSVKTERRFRRQKCASGPEHPCFHRSIIAAWKLLRYNLKWPVRWPDMTNVHGNWSIPNHEEVPLNG